MWSPWWRICSSSGRFKLLSFVSRTANSKTRSTKYGGQFAEVFLIPFVFPEIINKEDLGNDTRNVYNWAAQKKSCHPIQSKKERQKKRKDWCPELRMSPCEMASLTFCLPSTVHDGMTPSFPALVKATTWLQKQKLLYFRGERAGGCFTQGGIFKRWHGQPQKPCVRRVIYINPYHSAILVHVRVPCSALRFWTQRFKWNDSPGKQSQENLRLLDVDRNNYSWCGKSPSITRQLKRFLFSCVMVGFLSTCHVMDAHQDAFSCLIIVSREVRGG